MQGEALFLSLSPLPDSPSLFRLCFPLSPPPAVLRGVLCASPCLDRETEITAGICLLHEASERILGVISEPKLETSTSEKKKKKPNEYERSVSAEVPASKTCSFARRGAGQKPLSLIKSIKSSVLCFNLLCYNPVSRRGAQFFFFFLISLFQNRSFGRE